MVKKLGPSPNTGVVLPKRTSPRTFARAQALRNPDPSLARIDELRQGSPPRIAVVRSQGGIGDVLMTLPTVRAISEKYGVPITYATDFDYLDGALPAAVQGHNYISEIIHFRELDESRFDVVINLTCPCIVHEVPHAPPINRIDLFARHAGVILKSTKIDYVITPEEDKEARQTLEGLGLNLKQHRLVLINPFSSTLRRHIPHKIIESTVRELASERNTRCLVFRHGDDPDAIWDTIPGCADMKDYKLRQIAAMMNYCEMAVCPDSALLHLAGALDKKTVTFFGPTDPHARVNHFPRAVAIWGGAGLKCAPCWYEKCPCGFTCWKRIDYSTVIQTVRAVLNNKSIPNHPTLVHYPNQKPTSDYEVL